MAPSDIRLPAARTLGKWERLCLERIERDHRTARDRGYVFDEVEAREAVSFFPEFLVHHKAEWAGRPLELAEWQARNLAEIFGWRHADSAHRRYRQAWWETSKKNGKTQIAAGVGLRLLVADGEEGGEVYCTATKKEQALLAYVAACEMVRRSPQLSRFVMVPKGYRKGATMVCGRLGSKMEPLGADFSTMDGPSPSGDIRDEVHAWRDHGLPGVLDTAKAARRQPLTFEITTAGVYDEDGVGWQHHDYACKVVDGTYEDDSQFVYIAAADDSDDPYDPVTWWKANPNLGISPKLDFMARMAEKARRQPSFFNDFCRYHLNLWTQQATRWLPPEEWIACHRRDFDPAKLRGRSCVGGLDLSSVDDLTALVLVFREPDGSMDLLPRFWLPRETIDEAARRGRGYYAQWEKDGYLTATPGNVINYGFIRSEINELGSIYDIEEIGYDPYNSTQIATDLQGDGHVMVKTRQGFLTLSEPSKLLEIAVKQGRVRHGSPVLRWNGLNAAIETDPAGNIKPVKDVKRVLKIDGIAATVTALSRIVGAEPKEPEGAYGHGAGILVLE